MHHYIIGVFHTLLEGSMYLVIEALYVLKKENFQLLGLKFMICILGKYSRAEHATIRQVQYVLMFVHSNIGIYIFN